MGTGHLHLEKQYNKKKERDFRLLFMKKKTRNKNFAPRKYSYDQEQQINGKKER